MNGITNLIGSIVSSVFSGVLDKGIESITFKIKKWRFVRMIKTWVREYINSHDGTILTSGSFERFLKYYHPIEKMFSAISSTDETTTTRKCFVEGQVSIFFENCVEKQGNTPENRSEVAGFLDQFYGRISYFYRSSLKESERIILSSILSSNKEVMGNIADSTEIIKSGIDDIKSILLSKDTLNDQKLVRSIYTKISDYIWNGKGEDVEVLLPLLRNKNKDLEMCINFLLEYMKDCATVAGFEDLQDKVADSELYEDVVRKAIYLSIILENREMLLAVSDRNQSLYRIAQHILQNKYDSFFTVSYEEKEGVTYYEYEILKSNYPSEEWLVFRICSLKVLENNMVNSTEKAVEILGESLNLLDQAVIYNSKAKMMGGSLYSLKETEEFYSELKGLVNKASYIPKKFQCMLYVALYKTSFLISSEESEKVFKSLPHNILDDEQIIMLSMLAKIDSGEVDVNKILNISRKTGEYWLLNHYIKSIVNTASEKAKNIIEENKYVLRESLEIFVLYVQIIEKVYGVEQSLPLFNEYEQYHRGALEFWVIKLLVQAKNGIDIVKELDEVFLNWKKKAIHANTIEFEIDFIDMLIKNQRYDEALEYVSYREKFVGEKESSLPYKRRKGAALIGKKCEIEALGIYVSIFEEGDDSPETIYKILTISISNNRAVPEEVLEIAINRKESIFLMLAAICYEKTGNEDEAYNLYLKALLSNNGENDAVYNNYIRFQHKKPVPSYAVDMVDAGTFVVMQSLKDGHIKRICVHSRRILPTEVYEWGNTMHIYKEKSIQMGIFRKKENDSVVIEDEEYIIKELLSLETFFFRASMKKLVENGDMKELSLPVNENGEIKHEQFVNDLKAIIGDDKDKDWCKDYKNLSSVPTTFYMYNRFVRVTYTQLISAFIETPTIIFRENYTEPLITGKEYILTTSALIALFKIGFVPANPEIKVIIPQTLNTTICDETEQIIQDNNRETVAGMGILDDQLYFVESSENEKIKNISAAVELKQFCDKFGLVENFHDLQTELSKDIHFKEVLGISDYDALVIAKHEEMIMVTAEPATSMIAALDGVNVATIGIADFLLAFNMRATKLLSYIRKMLLYRFQIPLTPRGILYISNEYNMSNTAEKDEILNIWNDLLQIVLEDSEYKKWLAELFTAYIPSVYGTNHEYSPVVSSFLHCVLSCMGLSIELSFDENGNLTTNLVKIE